LSIYLLSNTNYEGVNNLPQIKINYLKTDIDFSAYEALIFTSKNSARAIQTDVEKWSKIPSYAIGEGTAQVLKELGTNLVYTSSNSYGDEFAKEIVHFLRGKNTLFLRGKKVLSNIENILKNDGVLLSSKIVYETTCKEKNLDIEFEDKSIFIFTSPSTVECFFKNYDWNESFRAVCIGKITASTLPLHVEKIISPSRSIKSSINLAKSLALE
jgi:uroporphyrinogen-III synthase